MSDIDAEFRAKRLAYGGGISCSRPRRRWGRILCITVLVTTSLGLATLGILNVSGVIGTN